MARNSGLAGYAPAAEGYGIVKNMGETILDDNGRSLLDNHPEAFLVLNEDKKANILLDGIHAGLGHWEKLGIPLDELRRWHAAYDVGTYEVICFLSQLLDCPAILCTVSRRVIECNRLENVKSQMDSLHDGVPVPGNENLSEEERAWRFNNLYHPYREKSRQLIGECAKRTKGRGLFLSIHSKARQVLNSDSYGNPPDDRIRPLNALLFEKSAALANRLKECVIQSPFFKKLVGRFHEKDLSDHPIKNPRPPYEHFEMNEPWDFKKKEFSEGTVIDMGQEEMEAITWEIRRDILSDEHWNVDLFAAEQTARAIASAVVQAQPWLVPHRTLHDLETMVLKSPQTMLQEAIAAAAQKKTPQFELVTSDIHLSDN